MFFHRPLGIFDPTEHAVRRLSSMPELSGSTELSNLRIAETKVSS